MTNTDRQSTRHHKMHTEEHALKKDSHLRLFSGWREPLLLVKKVKWRATYRQTNTDQPTDRRTDGQTDKATKNNLASCGKYDNAATQLFLCFM